MTHNHWLPYNQLQWSENYKRGHGRADFMLYTSVSALHLILRYEARVLLNRIASSPNYVVINHEWVTSILWHWPSPSTDDHKSVSLNVH